jgi:hypothetical protein
MAPATGRLGGPVLPSGRGKSGRRKIYISSYTFALRGISVEECSSNFGGKKEYTRGETFFIFYVLNVNISANEKAFA